MKTRMNKQQAIPQKTLIYWMGRFTSARSWHGARQLAQMEDLFAVYDTAVCLAGVGQYEQAARELAHDWAIPYPILPDFVIHSWLPSVTLTADNQAVILFNSSGQIIYTHSATTPRTAVHPNDLYTILRTPSQPQPTATWTMPTRPTTHTHHTIYA